MTSYIQLLNKIEAFCLAHKQIQKYGGEFREQMPNFSTKDTKYPMVFVSPSNGAPLYDTNEITLDIYCVDIIQKGRENLNTIVSDCHLILTDLYIYFSQGSDLTIDVLGTPSQTPLNNLDLDYVAGWMMTITFQVEGWCVAAIPMGDIPIGQGCEDATYIVEYADGTPIETGTIASGATKTIVVPNCPACEDATAELYFEDELIDTITVPCGDTGSIEIGCSTLMNAVKVVSTWQQHKHGGTFKHIGEENGKPKYEALHDTTKTIVYDGTKWQIIKTAPDAHVHNAANGNEAFPWLATWLDDYLTVTQATVGSFCTNGGIAYYNLVDTDGNLLAEGSISEGDEDNIVAPDATYSNSDNSYSGSVLSGGSLSIPDSQINVNGVYEGDVVSVKTIDVNITDGTNPVTPTSVTVVGNVVTAQVPVGGGLDPNAQAYITVNTSITNSGDITAIDDFFTGLKTDGLYANIKAMYLPIWGSATDNKWNLVDPRDLDVAFRLQFFGGVTHDADGVVGNGTNGYANTFYTPSIDGNLNSSHLSFYSQTNQARNEVEIGCWQSPFSGANRSFLQIRAAAGTSDHYQNDASFLNAANTDSRGFFLSNRASSNSKNLWKNGIKIGNQSTIPTAQPNLSIHLLHLNGTGTSNFSQKKCSFASIGEGFTDSQAVKLYNRVQALMTHFNIQQ